MNPETLTPFLKPHTLLHYSPHLHLSKKKGGRGKAKGFLDLLVEGFQGGGARHLHPLLSTGALDAQGDRLRHPGLTSESEIGLFLI